VLAVAGHVTMVGLGGGTFPMAFGSVPFGTSVSRPSWGTLPELREVVALAQAGRLSVEVEQFSLDETLVAYRRLRDGEIHGRAVVIM
jgi:propanol-preferring alcohol dehydrogenase